MMRRALLAVSTLALSAAALAQSGPNFGFQAGIYLPTASKTRQLFGNSLPSIGLGPVGFSRPSSGSVAPSFDLISGNKNGNKFLLIPFTYGIERHFGESKNTVPYVRLQGGVSYYDYSVNFAADDHRAAKTFGTTAGVEAGIVFNQSLRLAAKYNYFQKKDSLDFSGVQLSVTLGLAKF